MATKKDGLQAIAVLIGALFSQFILGGVTLSSGIFYVMFRKALNSSPVVTSWLCSLPMTLWFTAAPLGSVMINKFGFRVCSVVGGFIAAAGISLGFFADDIFFLFVSHGILTGIGFGISYTGNIAAVNSHFDKYRTLATGTISIGHNLGLVAFPFLIGFLEKTYGWRGTLLILGGLTFNMCTLAFLFRPIEENLKEKEALKQRPTFDFSILKKSSYTFYCFSNILTSISTGIYLLHLPSYANDIGFTSNDIDLVLTIYGVSNIIGKVMYSFLGQHPDVDVTMTYTVSLTATGVSIGLAPVFLSRAGMMILPGFAGFFYCVTGALVAAVIHRIVGHGRMAEGVGLAMPFKAAGTLIGGPMAGFLSETSGNYTTSFILSGVTMVMASVLMVYPIIYHRRKERAHLDIDMNLVCEKKVKPYNCNDVSVNILRGTEILNEKEQPLLDKPS